MYGVDKWTARLWGSRDMYEFRLLLHCGFHLFAGYAISVYDFESSGDVPCDSIHDHASQIILTVLQIRRKQAELHDCVRRTERFEDPYRRYLFKDEIMVHRPVC
jgi:hypothetical protein